MDIDTAIEAATEVLDQDPAMTPGEATLAESLEFAQGIAWWAETAISALKQDMGEELG